jgi:hypothetical protein
MWLYISALKMEAAFTSETLATFTRCKDPKSRININNESV